MVVHILSKLEAFGRSFETLIFDDLTGSTHFFDRFLDGLFDGDEELLGLRSGGRDVSSVALRSRNQLLLFGLTVDDGRVLLIHLLI